MPLKHSFEQDSIRQRRRLLTMTEKDRFPFSGMTEEGMGMTKEETP